MEKIIDLIIASFDFGYMFAVNILTYLVIKTIDQVNGPNKGVPVWLKRIIAVLCGLLLGGIICYYGEYSNVLLYSFIASLISWDTIFKPVIKYFKTLDYNKDEGNIGE